MALLGLRPGDAPLPTRATLSEPGITAKAR